MLAMRSVPCCTVVSRAFTASNAAGGKTPASSLLSRFRFNIT